MDHTSHAPPQPPPVHEGRRRLVREPEGRTITGVCGGLADALGVDAWLVRTAAVILAFATPAVIVAYVVLAVVLPERKPDEPRTRADRWCSGLPLHPVLVIAGVVVVASMIDGAWWLEPFPAALALVGVGVWLIMRDRDDALPPSPPPQAQPTMFGPPAPTPTTGPMGPDGPVDAPPATAAGEGLNGTTLTHPLAGSPWLGSELDGADGTDTSHAEGDLGATGDAGAQGAAAPPPPSYGAWWEAGTDPLAPTGAPAPVAPTPPPVREARLGRMVLAVLLLGGGVLWMGDSLDILEVSATTALALALVVVGLGLLVATWWGRAYGLIPVGLALAVALVLASLDEFPLFVGGGVGDRTEVIETVADMEETHRLSAGELTLDLTEAPLTSSDTPTVEARLGAGELRIVVPEDTTVELDAIVGAGELDAPDDDIPVHDGVGINENLTLEGMRGGGEVAIDAHVGLGTVVVVRDDGAAAREREPGGRTSSPTTAAEPSPSAAEDDPAPAASTVPEEQP